MSSTEGPAGGPPRHRTTTLDLDDLAAVARGIERQHAEALLGLGSAAERLRDGTLTFGGVGSYVNKALGFAGDLSEAELDRLETFFASRGVEPKIELSSFVPPELLAKLASRGFVLAELEDALVRPIAADEDLEHAIFPESRGWPSEVTIELVDPADDAELRRFIEVSASGFVPAGAPLPPSLHETGARAARVDGAASFLARVRGEIAGGGSAATKDGLTALFGTSVLPRFRRRGVQQALIAARLADGRRRGGRAAYIVSRPGISTERNAARLGFRMAYVRIVLVRHGEGLTPSP